MWCPRVCTRSTLTVQAKNTWFKFFMMLFVGSTFGKAPIECVDVLDANLVRTLGEKFTKMHIPKISELGKSDVEFDLQDNGNGCYVATEGDFDGKGQKNFAIAMTSQKSSKIWIIAAIKEDDGWKLYKLPSFCDGIASCFVRRENPGKFKRSDAIGFPTRGKFERERIFSKNQCIRTGVLESTEVVYVFSNGQWNYVVTSD